MKKKEAKELADLIHDENFDMPYDELNHLSDQIKEIIIDYYKDIRNPPIFSKKTIKEMRNIINEPLPQNGQNLKLILDELQKKIITNAIRMGNPRLLGWIVTSGTAIGAFADGIASALNQNVSISESAI